MVFPQFWAQCCFPLINGLPRDPGAPTIRTLLEVDRILLKHTLNMLVELGVQGKNVAGPGQSGEVLGEPCGSSLS